MMNRRDILYAALVGSNVSRPEPMRAVQNELMKIVGPIKPFVPFSEPVPYVPAVNSGALPDLWQNNAQPGKDGQFFTMEFETGRGKWLLPYEPMVSVSGKNTIVRRNVAKIGSPSNENTSNEKRFTGTIKERWSEDDFEITITGALYGPILKGTVEDCYPEEDMIRMMEHLRHAGSIRVYCQPLMIYGINHIVVESYSFPFTKGENVQAYEIKAYSDMNYDLILKS